MDLWKEMLAKIIVEEKVHVVFSNSQGNVHEIIEVESYKTLERIKAILEDDDLDDPECFMRIENIVRLFEQIGSDGGNRHDFG